MSKETVVKKAAYVAIGLPVHVADSFRRRFDNTRARVELWREQLAEGTQNTIHEWMEEGEHVVDSIAARARGRISEVEETVREGSATAREVGRGIRTVATEPIVPVESIDGVGPTYAEKLAADGVTSTRALVERCDSADAIDRLAQRTDIPAALISTWVEAANLSRINGIGPELMALLNAAGVGTIGQIAGLDATEIHERLCAINSELEVVSAVPGKSTLDAWIGQARSIAG